MKLVDKSQKISLDELKKIASKMYGELVKAVVDVEKKVMVISGKMHADEEKFLLEHGSQQKNLWGINIYPHKYPNDWIEIDSIINIRPPLGNFSRSVEDKTLAVRIIKTVESLIKI